MSYRTGCPHQPEAERPCEACLAPSPIPPGQKARLDELTKLIDKETRRNVDDMPAGREMDALIATRIFKRDAVYNKKPSGEESAVFVFAMVGEGRVPQFSTDIAAAWEVASHLTKRLGFFLHIYGQADQWTVCYISPNWAMRFNGEKVEPEGYLKSNSAALSICRAALKAVTP